MSDDHPDMVALKQKHLAEVNGMVEEFSKRHGELASVLPLLRDPRQILKLRSDFHRNIREAVSRHTKAENELGKKLAPGFVAPVDLKAFAGLKPASAD